MYRTTQRICSGVSFRVTARWIVVVVGLLAFVGPGSRIAPASNPDSKSPATTVTIFATVRDKKGNIVTDLTASDFVLTEDGKPQSLQYFSKAAAQPLTLGLVVDTERSQMQGMDQERSASGALFEQMVRADQDKAFVLHFDHEVELLQDLTASQDKLEQALQNLQTSQSSESQSAGSSNTDSIGQMPGGRGQRGSTRNGGAQLYDAIYLASNEVIKKQTGRKAMILLSDGVDHGSKETLTSALEAAQRANTIVYSVLIKSTEENYGNSSHGGFGIPGMGGPGMGRHGGGGRGAPQQTQVDGKKILAQISSETGGQLFEASKKQPLDQIYKQIEEDLRGQYNLGFTPAQAADSGAGFRKIQLTTTKKNLSVQTRAGYFWGESR
ncbi:MAG TPA: VWA domain-containing protein [Terriglobales bacterium]|nr:VWA domain-containing protein [Terriglobales bacterium]